MIANCLLHVGPAINILYGVLNKVGAGVRCDLVTGYRVVAGKNNLCAFLNESVDSGFADTIGAANPAAVQSMMQQLIDRYGPERLGCHFHDTRAMGLANVYAALQAGVRQFDASAGGLGGCPFAPGAKGNVATEDVVMLCESMGYQTGIDMPKLLDAVSLLGEMIGSPQGGRAHTWLTKQCA